LTVFGTDMYVVTFSDVRLGLSLVRNTLRKIVRLDDNRHYEVVLFAC